MTSNNAVVVIGASGFGRECLDVLEAMIASGSAVRVIGCVDDSPSTASLQRLNDRNVRYLGRIADWLVHRGNEKYVLGIGDPAVRAGIVAKLDCCGLESISAIHPSATLGARTDLRDGLVVCAGATISTNVRFGRHVHINPNATIGHDADLHDFVSVNPGATVSGEVFIGAGTLIGAAATILQGLTVGSGVIVGAGAVVTKRVPEGVVVKGIPGVWK